MLKILVLWKIYEGTSGHDIFCDFDFIKRIQILLISPPLH